MKTIRVLVRLVALTFVIGGYYSWLLLSSVVLGLVRGGGWAGPATALWRTRIFCRLCGVIVAVMGVKTEIQGRPPEPPFFLVSNHLSYLDILILASQVPCAFVSKAEVADWPVIGFLCRGVGTLFLDRGNKREIPRVIAQIEAALGQNRGVVIFPEGSTTCGADVSRFKPSLLETAAAAGLPVSYAALSYRTPPGSVPAQQSVCWWGGMTFGKHLLGMLSLPEILATLSFGEERILERDRKILAERLHYAVEAQFQPVN